MLLLYGDFYGNKWSCIIKKKKNNYKISVITNGEKDTEIYYIKL